jgi:hypothetical protein
VPVLCAAVLALGVFRLPDGAGFGVRFAGVTSTTKQSVAVEIVRLDDGGLEVVDPDHASWDRLSRLAQSDPHRVVSASLEVLTSRSGPLYPTLITREQQTKLTPWVDAAWSETDLRRAHDTFLAWLCAAHPDARPSSADATTTSLSLRHLLANTVLFLTLLLAVLSLAGQRRYMRVWIANHRLRRGLCGCCAYDLARIEPAGGVTTCPECGAAWPETGVRA